MPLNYRELSAPVVEPVDLPTAKAQLVVDASNISDDGLIANLITAARQYVEHGTNRSIYNRSMALYLDYFPFPDFSSTINPVDRHCLYGTTWRQLAIRLPKPGCVSVESITYLDLTGTAQTLSPTLYYVDVNS